MENKILLERKGRQPSVIKELVLDSCNSTSIAGLTDEFCNLENLSMVNVGLTNLKGFPRLPNLRKLELSENKISGDLQYVSDECPKLKSLHLNGNPINKIEDLAPLADLSNLKYLELCNCPVASVKNYRKEVFSLLPNLQFLDGCDQDDEEGKESDAENHRNSNCNSEKKVKEAEDSEEDSDEDEDDEEDDDGSSEDYSDSDEESVGLDYLQKSQIDEESEGNDYSPSGEEESDVDIESEEDYPRGQKRKLDDDE